MMLSLLIVRIADILTGFCCQVSVIIDSVVSM